MAGHRVPENSIELRYLAARSHGVPVPEECQSPRQATNSRRWDTEWGPKPESSAAAAEEHKELLPSEQQYDRVSAASVLGMQTVKCKKNMQCWQAALTVSH